MANAARRPEGAPVVKLVVTGALAALSAPSNGDAAQAMTDAEVALAQQNSAAAQLDLQVVAAILNAHLTAAEGREALDKLQQETEAAVRTRADLDTPAGARDFQRFLVGKLRDIRTVVANASLDDTSKSALMTAWTSLYDISKNGPGAPGEQPQMPAMPAATTPQGARQESPVGPTTGMDPYLESLLDDDPGFMAGGDLSPQSAAAPPMPMMPMLPSIPNLGGGLPGVGSMPGWGAQGGVPLPGLLQGAANERSPRGRDEALLASDEPNPKDQPSSEETEKSRNSDARESSVEVPDARPPGPTTVTLPNGDTVTAASPQLAAAIKAAAGGTAIPDAFQQQGITIPPPGTPVANPIDLTRVTAGDIGIFTDRHALALGHEKALLNGQIQHISTVKGPSFLGWEHPPTPVSATGPAATDKPTPTRPAAPATGDNGGPPTQPPAH